MNKILFKETQQFRQWWFILLILAATVPSMIFSISGFWKQFVQHISVGNELAPDFMYVVSFFIMALVLWGFFVMKLEVWIDSIGIHYRFFPLILRNKLISKAEIQRYEIRKYSPLKDYGGWGLRRGFGRKWGRGFVIDGNMGLQLYLTNGKKVLFGTQRSQAILYAMDEMMKK